MSVVIKDLALFFEFLAQEGVTAQFFENWVSRDLICRESSDTVVSFAMWVLNQGVSWGSYITSSFLWCSSPEGSDYWVDVNFKWLRHHGTVCE